MELYNYPNMQVRVQAAKRLLLFQLRRVKNLKLSRKRTGCPKRETRACHYRILIEGYSNQPESRSVHQRRFAIDGELSKRPGDQRTALSQLFSQSGSYVRFNAAVESRSVVKAEARAVIQDIAESRVYPLAGEAGVFLSMYDGEMSKLLRSGF